MEDPRYPIGRFRPPDACTPESRAASIRAIEALPAELRAAVSALPDVRLDEPYREGGWTRRQVVHHLADSHMNAYIRFKLAVTEDEPTIKPYDEARWALLADASGGPVAPSLDLIEALHHRWAVFLRSLEPEALARTFRHPQMGVVTLDRNLALYAWHGRHHVAHIRGGTA